MLRALVLLSICVGAVGCAHGQDGYYTMQRGDTLYSVSRHVGVPVEQLVTANGIDDVTDVPVGTRLRVPGTAAGLRPLEPAASTVSAAPRPLGLSARGAPAASPSTPDTYAPETYRMVKGDTLYSIAARFGLDAGQLMQRNDIDDPTDLATGTVLTLEGVGRRAAGAAAVSGAAAVGAAAVGTSAVGTAVSLEGPLLWPTDGERQPLTGRIDGVAIHGDAGQPVRSVSSGTVTWSGPQRGYGYVVLVRNGSYVYGYLNNRQVQVEVGDQVQVGSQIGQLGVNPHDNTAQLYFVVVKDGRYVDPRSAPRA